MLENGMLIGNAHDSATNDFMDYCQGCGGEIYYGEGYLDCNGDPIHAEADCIKQFVQERSVAKVAGE
ncbi:hypothetical protein [Bacillus sp. NPDC060175]|uniref:hypothetical protein n=1 Tax=Bacillus sp. NPDC060175 TaxID=3347061 RepID=UPI00365C26FF